MILLQMSIPQLRTPANMNAFSKWISIATSHKGTDILFSSEVGEYFHDLNRWRQQSSRAQGYDFSLLDMRNAAGWDLANKLVRRRNDFLR